MNELVYPHERTLGDLILVFGLLIWLILVVGTFGLALVWLAFGFVVLSVCPVHADCPHQG